MIAENHCPRCKTSYTMEVHELPDYNDDYDGEMEVVEEYDGIPRYCPFCGLHRRYDDDDGFEFDDDEI